MRIIVLTFFMISLSLSLQAQCTVVRGIVKDLQTSEVLPGASVRALKANSVNSTDVNGKFEIATVDADSLAISFIGYETVILALPSGCFVEASLISSYKNLVEVEVSSDRLISEEFTMYKMKKLDIYTNPSAKADPLLAVNSSPAATTLDESANISLRGSSPGETGVFLNNVPINDAVRYAQLNGIGTFSIFNTALINQVQVYPGNPPLDFGNSTSGLIALYTDEVIPEKSNYTAGISLASIGLYTQQKLSRSSSLTAFTNYQPSVAIRWVNQRALLRVKNFSTVDAGIHYFLKLNQHAIVKVFNYSSIESFEYRTKQPTYSGIFNQQKKRNYTVSNVRFRKGRTELAWNSGVSLSASGFSLSTLDISFHQRSYYTALTYQFQAKQFEIKSGASYDYRSNRTQGTYPVYDFAIGEQYPSESFRSSEHVHLPEIFLYGKYYFHAKWIAGAGIRKSLRAHHQRNYLSRQFNLSFNPTESWNIIASLGQYNKIHLSQNGSTSPASIHADQYGIDVRFSQFKAEFSLSAFYKSGSEADADFKTTGIELFGKYRFSQRLRTQLSVTSLRATQTEGGVTTSTSYDIHYFIRGNAEYKIAGTWTVSLVFLVRQGSFYKPVTDAVFHPVGAYQPMYGEAERLPNYNLIDLSFSKLMMWSKQITAVAFCGISNLPNSNNVRDYSYNFNYTKKKEDLFSLRTLYMGCVINF